MHEHLITRLHEQVQIEPMSGCYLWMGEIDKDGYGKWSWGARLGVGRMAHRIAYTLLRGPIPAGLSIDHLCNVRCCVNVEHLRAVPIKENVLRSAIGITARYARATHCVNEHLLAGDNLYMRPDQHRACRTCRQRSNRIYKAKRKPY